MAKKIDIEEFDDGMEEQGYSRETREIVLEQAETMHPGHEKLESEDIIYIAPLDRTLSLLSSVIYQRTEALKAGHTNVRWGILLITDGVDNQSKKAASEVKTVLDNMKKKGELLEKCEPDNMSAGSIALMGVEDRKIDPEAVPHFETIARSMGIGWIVHADRADDKDMRRAFNAFSKPYASKR